jgi:transposase-like protein
MSILSKPYFHDEAAAFEHVEALLWADGPVCPHCGGMDRVYALKGVRSKPSKKNPQGVERHGLKKCGHCRKQFTVRIGTIFEESHIPLHKWLQAIYLMTSSKKGISANQLHRTLEITLKSAWFLAHRIREAMKSDGLPLGGEGVTIEADETYIGNRKGNKHETVFVNGKGFVKRGGGRNQMKIVTLVERGGRAKSVRVHSVTANAVRDVLAKNADRKSDLMTDEANVYKMAGKGYKSHQSVNHSDGEYGRGVVHTNTIEGYFSIFKRGMKGIYQHCAEHHLERYLAEFDFRYSNRVAAGVNDEARAVRALLGVKGKRLTYNQPA